MHAVQETFYWRSVVIVILIAVALAGALLVRLIRAWWRRIGSRGRLAGPLPAESRGPGSDVAADPFTRRARLARPAEMPAPGQDGEFRDAA